MTSTFLNRKKKNKRRPHLIVTRRTCPIQIVIPTQKSVKKKSRSSKNVIEKRGIDQEHFEPATKQGGEVTVQELFIVLYISML